jgi:hypothetical protein
MEPSGRKWWQPVAKQLTRRTGQTSHFATVGSFINRWQLSARNLFLIVRWSLASR